MLSLSSTQVGMILLSDLFFTTFSGSSSPPLVTWQSPLTLNQLLFLRLDESSKKPQFSMLGLGDIVMPGICRRSCCLGP